MAMVLGISGASRNAALALCDGGRVVGVCEHERITRTRSAALTHGQLPKETLRTMLQLGACTEDDISAIAVAEKAIRLPPGSPVTYVDHHLAHAATAFYSSAFHDATIVVCDRGGSPELTVWRGDERGIRQEDFGWSGPGFASVYSMAAEAMGFRREATSTGSKRWPAPATIVAARHPGDWVSRRPPRRPGAFSGLDCGRDRNKRLERIHGRASQPRRAHSA